MIEDFKRNLGASLTGAPASDVPERPRDHEHDCRDDSEDNYYRRFKTMCVNAPITPQTSKSRTRRKEATAEISGRLPRSPASGGAARWFHSSSTTRATPVSEVAPIGAAPAVPRYVLAQAARPFLASIIIQETCRERVSSRVMFPKAPCDRPTFAATRSYWVPPRTSRRACVLRQRARAWRMRRLGRNSSALRCVGAIRRPDVTRRNHTQACERRARSPGSGRSGLPR